MEDATKNTPFDERAALEELDRIRDEIEKYRAERKAVDERFDRFIRSFKTPVPEPEAIASPMVRAAGRGSTPPPPAGPATVPAVQKDAPGAAALPPPAVRKRGSTKTVAVLGGTLVLLTAGGYVARSLRKPLPPQAAAPSAPAPSPASPGAAQTETASAPVPGAAAPQPRVTSAELTTTRRAWVRLVVDGERVLERELPADTRIPFDAEHTVVIRTGDAGAVRLSIRGEDQGALGREGAVVTRTFTVPASAEGR